MSEKISPFDYINIINTKGKIPENLEGYEPFIVNRNYSHVAEYLLYANAINVDCDKQLNFDFYYSALPKKKLYTKWSKKQKENSAKKETLNNIVEHYNCSMVKAQEIYDILESNKLLKVFAEMTDKGGK